jgi:hypothetical protein
MQIVLEVSDELKSLADDLVLFVRSLQARLDRLRAEPNVDYAAVEKQLADDTAAIERRAHQVLLSALDLDAPAVLIDGVVHARVGRHPATYYTSAGEVVVERSIYREPRNRSARAVDPVSLRAGVVGEGVVAVDGPRHGLPAPARHRPRGPRHRRSPGAACPSHAPASSAWPTRWATSTSGTPPTPSRR